MLFNTVEFFVFFPVVTILYFTLPHRYRWGLLLVASCYFYMRFIPAYILILFLTISIDYIAGIAIENSRDGRRKLFLVSSIVANIGVLAIFKYFNFMNDNLEAVFGFLGWKYPITALEIILPIGLSFHTFQSLSYTIEVYRGVQKAERNPGIFALYVMFYPQLVAGPIERPQNMLHQFHEKKTFDYLNVTNGLKLMTWGLFKKVVIADRMAVVVNQVYGDPHGFTGIQLIVATLCFAYQIYCDFSGYSDMAIGAAQVMGFKFMDNFRHPYAARSISEFWSRWHISLSTWFRDYLYIPLGGNRVSSLRWQMNLFITFLVSGLWHGANWTFVLWGALHGFYLIASIWTAPLRSKLTAMTGLGRYPRLLGFLQVAGTFSLVTFAWIFFRTPTLADGIYIATHLFSGIGSQLTSIMYEATLASLLTDLGYYKLIDWLILILSVCLLEVVQYYQRRGGVRERIAGFPFWQRWALYYGLVLSILYLGVFNRSQFIYFQF